MSDIEDIFAKDPMSDLLKKQKTTAQAAFTRIFNSLTKLLHNPNATDSILLKNCDELEERYKVFESRCENILEQIVEEDSNLYKEINALLADKYELLNDICNQVSLKVNASQEKVGHNGSKNDSFMHSSTVEQTQELIRSFTASLTLPKPSFKKFNGSSNEYSSFIAYIETYVEPNVENKKQCLSFLIDSCCDIAYEAISFLSQCQDANAAYARAKAILKDLFGRKHQIMRAILDECTNGPPIKIFDIQGLRKLTISMRKAEITLTECNSTEELTATDKLVRIFQRLPKPLQNRWNDKLLDINGANRKPSLVDMCNLIECFVHSRDNEYNVDFNNQFKKGSNSNSNSSKPIFALNEGLNAKSNVRCTLCKSDHYLNQCPTFLQMDLKSRYDFVSRMSLCRNCLHYGHIASTCKKKALCKQCSAKHNNVLHDCNFRPRSAQNQSKLNDEHQIHSKSNVELPNSNPESAYNITSSNENTSSKNVVGLACVDVIVEGSDAYYKCKAIVDPKSSANLCTNKLADKLKLQSQPFKSTFNVATGSYDVQGKKLAGTTVYSRDMTNFVVVKDIMAVKSIPISMNSIFSPKDIHGVDHLKDVIIPECSDSDEIELLIGSGCPKAFHQFEQRKHGDNEIYAVRQTLGWDLVGPKRSTEISNNSYSSALLSNNSECLLLISNMSRSHNNDLKKVFSPDFDDCFLFDERCGPSIEDMEAQQIVEKSIRLEKNQFVVNVPWKQNPENLPSNKNIVLKGMISLKKRFESDQSLLENYTKEMNVLIENGFLEKSNPISDDTKLVHYIPHHPVWHHRKDTIRIVWDCAVSLNDFIFEGPDIMNSLLEILLRFRRYKWAVCSDITKMYLSVKMPCSDRGAFRVLWWPNGDLSKDYCEYRATVHIWGAKSSGFIANYCMKKIAHETNDKDVSDLLLNDLYVDDQVSSFEIEEKACSVLRNACNALEKSCFHLTKFISNSSEVMNVMDVAERLGSKNVDEMHHVLGLGWNVQTDMISIPCPFLKESQNVTLRSLLSVIAQVYDPGGFSMNYYKVM